MNPPRILIVEDEAIVAMELEERLAAMGYQLAGLAAGGEQALTLCGRERPDLVLMDIRLQGAMDGIDTAREIRSRFRTPVIFVTAYSEDSTLQRAKLAEPCGYILKPFDDRELRSSIEIALCRHAAEEEIRRLNRLYDVLSQVNQAIVRIRTREELLPTVCRLVVERGAMDLAWIGWLDPESQRLSPVAHFGEHGEMLGDTGSPHADGSTGQSSPLHAIREGRPFICNACGSGDCPYGGEASPASMGLQSCGSFPIRFQGEIAGVLTLCAREPHLFRDREIALLEEVALDISFALDKIEGDAQRVRAEQALRASESRYRKLFEEATEGIVLADAETGEILDCNQAFEELSGYERRELIGKPQAMLHPPENGDPAVSISFEAHGGSMEGQVIPAEILRRTGEALVVEIKANVLEKGRCVDGHELWTGRWYERALTGSLDPEYSDAACPRSWIVPKIRTSHDFHSLIPKMVSSLETY